MLSAVSHTVVMRPSGATAGLITVEFNYELSYITTESLISIHPLAPLTRWHHAVCAQSAYRVHIAIVLSENEAFPMYSRLIHSQHTSVNHPDLSLQPSVDREV